MHYLTIETSTLESDLFLRATAEQKGIWLDLNGYCASQENQGIVKECRDWPDTHWQRLIGHNRDCLLKESPLWFWKDKTLMVNLYNIIAEENVKKLRRYGKEGAQKRWKLKSKHRGAIRGANGGAYGNSTVPDRIAPFKANGQGQ